MYRFILVDQLDQELESFIDNSPQKTIYTDPSFLKQLMAFEFRFLVVFKGSAIKAVSVVFYENHKIIHGRFPYYSLLLDQNMNDKKNNKKLHVLLDEMLIWIHKNMNDLNYFNLHHSFEDTRAFDWTPYSRVKQEFRSYNRYTSLLDFNEFSSFEDYLKRLKSARLSDLRKADSEGYETVFSDNFFELEKLILNQFEERGELIQSHELSLLRDTWASPLLDTNLALTYDSEGELASSSLFAFSGEYAYYIMGATFSQHRNFGVGTQNLFHQLRSAFNKKNIVDFLGINSPYRGYYKSSFGGNLKVNYVLKRE